jgi:hypothetical protein
MAKRKQPTGAEIDATIEGGDVRGVVGAQHVVIENQNFFGSTPVAQPGDDAQSFSPREQLNSAPPPDLHLLVKAQSDAAQFYVVLIFVCVSSGLFLASGGLVLPVLVAVPEPSLTIALLVGGGLVAAVGTLPSGKYLERKDRASALRTISLQYDRLQTAGLLASPARRELDKMYTHFVQGMIK